MMKSKVPSLSPILKWPGGKRKILSQLTARLPSKFKRYYEPFAGGAALFFHLQPEFAIVADVNEEVVNCYQQLQVNSQEVRDILRKWKNSERRYYAVRDKNPQSDVERAARLLYLCTLSFNGVYRVNLAGQFNVPYGYKEHLNPSVLLDDADRLELIRRATFRHGDFEETTFDAKSGDLIYFDPPYTLAHNNNGFVKYNERMFSWSDQERLAKYASQLIARGCHVLVSNGDHCSVRDLYPSFKCVQIERTSVIAADPSRRRLITECLFIAKHDD